MQRYKVEVTINGESHNFDKKLNISQMLQELQLDPTRIAVEKNLVIINDDEYESINVESGDSFEIVHFIGGG